ncbi:MAG: hypothetical protein K1X29_06895 [Bdellovibrionales bacterium]|nr:hypothetical protein [Bdellovibrionales bacterium]
MSFCGKGNLNSGRVESTKQDVPLDPKSDPGALSPFLFLLNDLSYFYHTIKNLTHLRETQSIPCREVNFSRWKGSEDLSELISIQTNTRCFSDSVKESPVGRLQRGEILPFILGLEKFDLLRVTKIPNDRWGTTLVKFDQAFLQELDPLIIYNEKGVKILTFSFSLNIWLDQDQEHAQNPVYEFSFQTKWQTHTLPKPFHSGQWDSVFSGKIKPGRALRGNSAELIYTDVTTESHLQFLTLSGLELQEEVQKVSVSSGGFVFNSCGVPAIETQWLGEYETSLFPDKKTNVIFKVNPSHATIMGLENKFPLGTCRQMEFVFRERVLRQLVHINQLRRSIN